MAAAGAIDEPAGAQARAAALRVAAQLPPLALAVVHLADALLRDVVCEVAEQSLHPNMFQ